MKSLNVKIPVDLAERMSDNAELNPSFLNKFIAENYHLIDEQLDKPLNALSYNYTFKVDSSLHKDLKMTAVELDIPMNELIGRLLVKYFEEDECEWPVNMLN